MTLKTALLASHQAPDTGPVLLGTAGGFVLQGTIEPASDEDAQVISFKLVPGAGAVERANGSAIKIASGRLLIPIASIAWISQA